jgi:hypothetical protein
MSQVLIPNSVATFLNLRHLPARLTTEQIAAVLGFHPHHIPLLVLGKFLRLDNAPKFLTKYWQDKNSRRMVTAEADETGSSPT